MKLEHFTNPESCTDRRSNDASRCSSMLGYCVTVAAAGCLATSSAFGGGRVKASLDSGSSSLWIGETATIKFKYTDTGGNDESGSGWRFWITPGGEPGSYYGGPAET